MSRTTKSNTPTESVVIHRDSGAGWAESRQGARSTQIEQPRALLVAVAQSHKSGTEDVWSTENSLEELAALASAGDIIPVRSVIQNLSSPHPRTYVGEGKAREIADWRLAEDCSIVLFDDELSPSQQRNLEEILGAGTVVDRTQLILDIFAARARTSEGALQVELAQARYQLPRLRRLWTHLERQRGGAFTRGGAGETQMEADKRVLRTRIERLQHDLETVRQRRARQRATRHDAWPTISLVGYTNAGKSTLLNRLTGASVLARDQLFATLDPTTRRWLLAAGGDGPEKIALLTDTVGFIHKLPTGLIAAFRATLEEVAAADLLLHVLDASSPHALGQAQVVEEELRLIGATNPILTVLNKTDQVTSVEQERIVQDLFALYPSAVAVSAVSGQGCDLLTLRTAAALQQHKASAPTFNQLS